MHWIQTIRAQLEISQEELAVYLGVSLHTLQSVEQGRRNLPFRSMQPAMIAFQAVVAARTDEPPKGFTEPTDEQLQRKKHPYRQYHRTLARCQRRLEAMQRAHASAVVNLGIYQHIAQSLADQDHPVCRQWTERKIAETISQVKDNDTSAQDLLLRQVDMLKDITRVVEQRHGDQTA